MPPTILPFPGVATATTSEDLLDEAIELARKLGQDVRAGWLDVREPSARWTLGRKRITLSVTHTPEEQLACVADSLQGEPRLAGARMSADLRSYLAPRRAA